MLTVEQKNENIDKYLETLIDCEKGISDSQFISQIVEMLLGDSLKQYTKETHEEFNLRCLREIIHKYLFKGDQKFKLKLMRFNK